MENKLSLFGTELQTYSQDMEYDDSKGVAFSDDDWSDATKQNSTIRKTGFVPGSAASSLAMNTALRQACFGSKLFGDVITNIEGINLGEDITSDEDNETVIQKVYTRNIVSYLDKIQQLIKGTKIVSKTTNSINTTNFIDGSELKNIDIEITGLENSILNTTNDIQNGVVIAKIAHDYNTSAEFVNNNIPKSFTNIDTKLATAQAPTRFDTISAPINIPWLHDVPNYRTICFPQDYGNTGTMFVHKTGKTCYICFQLWNTFIAGNAQNLLNKLVKNNTLFEINSYQRNNFIPKQNVNFMFNVVGIVEDSYLVHRTCKATLDTNGRAIITETNSGLNSEYGGLNFSQTNSDYTDCQIYFALVYETN